MHSKTLLAAFLFICSIQISYAMPGGGGGSCSPAENCSSAPSLTLNTVYSYDNSGCGANPDCASPTYPICGCAPCGNEDCSATIMGMSCFIEGAFCGSPENTSWARFCPTVTTSYSFTVSNISCSGGGASLQFGLYAAGVACGSNTQSNMLDCTGGTVTTTSFTENLVAGQCYLIVFDGNAGAQCTWNFQITGILPVSLASYEVAREQRNMVMRWSTSREQDSKEFHIVRRYDNLIWEEGLTKDELYNKQKQATIAILPAQNLSGGATYSFVDAYVVDPGLYVYSLYQKDFNGTMHYLGAQEAYVDVPTQARVTGTYSSREPGIFEIEFETKLAAIVALEVFDIRGNRVSGISSLKVNPGTFKLPVDLRTNAAGVYLYDLKVNGENFRGKLLNR